MLDNLRTIAFEEGMIRHRNEFELKQKDIKIKFANMGGTGIFYLNRKVALKDTTPDVEKGHMPPEMSILPATGPGLHRLKFPQHGYRYLPMIAVFDNDFISIEPNEFCLPRKGKAFFRSQNKNAYNYTKKWRTFPRKLSFYLMYCSCVLTRTCYSKQNRMSLL